MGGTNRSRRESDLPLTRVATIRAGNCPPNLGLLAVNALAAADEVLVPVETHGIAAVGLSDLLRTVEDARESMVNTTLTVGAIVATRFMSVIARIGRA